MQKLNPKCDYKAYIIDWDEEKFDIKGISFEPVDQSHPTYIKYKSNPDLLRWTHKPILLSALVEHYERVIYIDPDIYFVHSWDFLLSDIDGVLLTKHHRSLIPDTGEYKCLFTDGFFNAGFIGASRKGKEALLWWQSVIHWKCEKNYAQGLFDDQKYLDVMALEFNDTVKICKQLGCNLANWNKDTIKTYRLNRRWYVEKDDSPVIFLHITQKGKSESVSALDYYKERYHRRVFKISQVFQQAFPRGFFL